MASAQVRYGFTQGESLARLSRFVGRRTGLFKEPFPSFLPSHLPDIFVFNADPLGSGAALSETEALICTIGESIERHSSQNYEPEDEVVCAFRDLGVEAPHPSRFALFSEAQYRSEGFPYVPFTEDAAVRWTTGHSLTDQRPISVPSCLTYLSHRQKAGEALIGPSTSNGLSCHFDRNQAILKSLYEVIERDAFFTMWLNRLSMPRLAIGEAGPLSETFGRRFNKPGIEYHFVDLTNDIGIPVVSCLVRMRHTAGVLAGVGAAANLDPEEALLKAMVEATHTLVWCDAQISRGEWTFDPTFSNIRDFADHVRLYCEPQMQPELDFMISSQSLSGVSDLASRASGNAKEDLDTCLRLLERRGLEAILVDATPQDVADAGLSIVKVAVPEAVAVNGQHRLRFLGGNRLYETPRVLGYSAARTCERDLNTAPHPFP